MTIRLCADGTIALEGDCPIEDAEKLQQHLINDPAAAVDWRACTAAHTAIVQILLAARPTLRGPPQHDFLARYLEPALKEQVS